MALLNEIRIAINELYNTEVNSVVKELEKQCKLKVKDNHPSKEEFLLEKDGDALINLTRRWFKGTGDIKIFHKGKETQLCEFSYPSLGGLTDKELKTKLLTMYVKETFSEEIERKITLVRLANYLETDSTPELEEKIKEVENYYC